MFKGLWVQRPQKHGLGTLGPHFGGTPNVEIIPYNIGLNNHLYNSVISQVHNAVALPRIWDRDFGSDSGCTVSHSKSKTGAKQAQKPTDVGHAGAQ